MGDAPLDHRGTAPQLLGRLGEREPIVPLREIREALVIPDICYTVRPPRFARPRPIAQAVQRGGNQWHLRITVPKHGLPGTAQLTQLLEDAGDGVLYLTVGDLFKAIVTRVHKPDGDFPHDPVGFWLQRLAGRADA